MKDYYTNLMKMANNDLDKKELTKKVISVADAVAMNAAPEYWLSFKLAGIHLLALFSIARTFLLQSNLHHLTN